MKTQHRGLEHRINKSLNELDRAIKWIEKEKEINKIIKEIPITTLNIFNSPGRHKFKSIYLDNRLSGLPKGESLKLTLSLVTRSFSNNKTTLLQGIQKTLEKIKDRLQKTEFLGDETQIEEFPPKDEIPIIEGDGEDNIEKSEDMDEEEDEAEKGCGPPKKNKADGEEGDTKIIFGKPFVFSGGEWVPQDGNGGEEEKPEDTLSTTEMSEEELRDKLKKVGYTNNELDKMGMEDLAGAYDDAYVNIIVDPRKQTPTAGETNLMMTQLREAGFTNQDFLDDFGTFDDRLIDKLYIENIIERKSITKEQEYYQEEPDPYEMEMKDVKAALRDMGFSFDKVNSMSDQKMRDTLAKEIWNSYLPKEELPQEENLDVMV